MHLLILGASGGVGRHLLTRAASQGHRVTVLARTASRVDAPEGVRVVHGEIYRGEGLGEAMPGVDAVLSTIGLQRRNPANPWSRMISPPDLTSVAARHVTEAMQAHGVRRVVALSAAGVGDSRARLNAVMRFFLATTMIGTAYDDLARMEDTYARSGLDWLAPRPTRLVDAPSGKPARVVDAFGTSDHIARADVAAWMLPALDEPSWPAGGWGGRTPQISA